MRSSSLTFSNPDVGKWSSGLRGTRQVFTSICFRVLFKTMFRFLNDKEFWS